LGNNGTAHKKKGWGAKRNGRKGEGERSPTRQNMFHRGNTNLSFTTTQKHFHGSLQFSRLLDREKCGSGVKEDFQLGTQKRASPTIRYWLGVRHQELGNTRKSQEAGFKTPVLYRHAYKEGPKLVAKLEWIKKSPALGDIESQ